jgi:hypothetical protein
MRNIIILFLIALSWSCGGKDPKENAVARVFDSYLYETDLKGAVPYGTSAKDSTALAEEFINTWTKKQLVLRKAESNLTDEQKDVEKQLEDYRASLIIFAYERELVRQKLDTVVSDSEIESYYKSNPANFELKSNIIRLRYVKIPVKTPNKDKVKLWFNGSSAADRNKLEQYCKLYAVNYLLDDANWLLYDDVLKEIPLNNYPTEQLKNNKKSLELSDDEYHYIVNVTGFMVKESSAPLSFEKESIRNRILNKRKIQLVQKMQLDAYNDALNNNDIETFKKK